MRLLIQLFVLLPKSSVLKKSSKLGMWRQDREEQMSEWLLLSMTSVSIIVQCWYCQLCISRTADWLDFLQLQLEVQNQQGGQMRGSALSVWRILWHVKWLVRKIQFFYLIFVVPCIMINSEINPTRCNNCVYSSQWLYFTCFGSQFHPSSGVQCCIWPFR